MIRNILGMVIVCCVLVSQGLAEVQWENTTIKRDVAVETKLVEVEFPFVNAGDQEVTIKRVRRTEGSIRAGMVGDKTTYKPGESGTVWMSFETGSRTGSHSKEIVIYFDDDQQSKVSLFLNVKIEGWITVSPKFVTWRIGEEAVPAKMSVIVTRDKPLDIKMVQHDDKLEVQLKTIEQGRRYEVIVKPSSTDKRMSSRVHIEAELPDGSKKWWPIKTAVFPKSKAEDDKS